jgi:hypothetical protein
MAIQYGIATYDRGRGIVECEVNLHMKGVQDGGFVEFLESAGKAGWELCGTFPSGTRGSKVAQPGKAELRVTGDPEEYITFIFKKV